MRTFKIHPLSEFQVHSTVLLTVSPHCTLGPRTCSSSETLYPLTYISQFSPSPPAQEAPLYALLDFRSTCDNMQYLSFCAGLSMPFSSCCHTWQNVLLLLTPLSALLPEFPCPQESTFGPLLPPLPASVRSPSLPVTSAPACVCVDILDLPLLGLHLTRMITAPLPGPQLPASRLVSAPRSAQPQWAWGAVSPAASSLSGTCPTLPTAQDPRSYCPVPCCLSDGARGGHMPHFFLSSLELGVSFFRRAGHKTQLMFLEGHREGSDPCQEE